MNSVRVELDRRASRLAIVLVALLITPVFLHSQSQFTAPVTVWDPPFNTQFQRRQETYVGLEQASRPWRIAVLIPHLKDSYWWAINYGLVDQARKLGVELQLFVADGYGEAQTQRTQFERVLIDDPPDGIILSAVQVNAFDDLIARASELGIPVVDQVNGVTSSEISARVAVSYVDTGVEAGRYLANLVADRPSPANVLLMPGPEGAGWAMAGEVGLLRGLEGANINEIRTVWGDTGRYEQSILLENVFRDGFSPDYIIGTTVSAEAAVAYLQTNGLSNQVGVLAYYYGPGVHRAIERGQVIAAPTEQQTLIARIALDVVVRILEGEPYYEHVGPLVSVVDRRNIADFDTRTTLAPMGFRPVFSVDQ